MPDIVPGTQQDVLLDNLVEPPKKPGAFGAGLAAGKQGLKSAGGGLVQLAGRAVGVPAIEARGAEIVKAAAEATPPPPVTAETALDSPGNALDFVKYTVGSQLPNVAVTLLAGLVGRSFGGVVTAGSASGKAVGLGAGLGASAVGQEAGQIFPEAVQTGVENPVGRTAVGAIAAGALDTALPALLARRFGLLGAPGATRPAGAKPLLESIVKGSAIGGAVEAGTETAQTYIERIAAGQSLDDNAAKSDLLNSGAAGLVMGALMGGLGGAFVPTSRASAENVPQNQVVEASAVPAPPAADSAPLNQTLAPPELGPINAAFEQSTLQRDQPGAPELLQAQHEVVAASVDELDGVIAGVEAQQARRVEVAAKLKELAAEARSPERTRTLREITLDRKALEAERDALPKPSALKDTYIEATRKRAELVPQVRELAAQVDNFAQDVPAAVAQAAAVPELTSGTRTQEQLLADAAYQRDLAEQAHARQQQEDAIAASGQRSAGVEDFRAAPNAMQEAAAIALQRATERDARTKERENRAAARAAAAAAEAEAPRVADLRSLQRVNDRAPVTPEERTRLLDHGLVAEQEDGGVKLTAAGHRTAQSLKRAANTTSATVKAGLEAQHNAMLAGIEAAVAITDAKNASAVGGTPTRAKKLKQRVIEGVTAAVQDAFEVPTAAAKLPDRTQVQAALVQKLAKVPGLTKDQAQDVADHVAKAVDRGPVFSHAGITTEQLFSMTPEVRNEVIDDLDRSLEVKGEALIARLKQLIGDDKHLTVDLYAAEPGSPIGSYTRTGPLKSTIALALNSADGVSVADHEGFHYLEDQLLTAHERQAVARGFAPGSRMYKALLDRARAYDGVHGTQIADIIASSPVEARAYGFQFWRAGELQPQGAWAQAFAKIKDFLDKVFSYITGQGFASIESVFDAIDRGQFAERARRSENSLYVNGVEIPGDTFNAGGVLEQSTDPFYSALALNIGNLSTNAASSQGWRDAIKGMVNKGTVKQVEVDATGLNEWLELQTGRVPKQQVQDFLAQNGVKVEEVELGNTDIGTAALTPEEKIVYDRLVAKGARRSMANLSSSEIYVWNILRDKTAPAETLTKFPKWQLPGGENYRELLLTLPVKEPSFALDDYIFELNAKYGVKDDGLVRTPGWDNGDLTAAEFEKLRALQAAQKLEQGPVVFQSSHFDQPNILAHIRFNERTDADGKRVLFLEEIQSDWAQKGKKEGFGPAPVRYTVRDRNGNIRGDFTTRAEAEAYRNYPPIGVRGLIDDTAAIVEAPNVMPGIPSAPFVGKTEAWVGLSMKRMIRYAAENGFDRVAWTNGEQQAARYDLSAHVDMLVLYPDNTLGGFKGGRNIFNQSFTDESGLAALVGKDVAKKLLATKSDMNNQKVLAGVDLKVGGEGMKAFYDKIVPNVANDVLKKLGGGRVGDVNVALGRGTVDGMPARYPDRSDQPGFDITPAIRSRAMAGQPLFSQAAVDPLVAQATRGMARQIKHGELPREQIFNNVTELIDRAETRPVDLKTRAGARTTAAAGTFTRARHYIATQNYIAKFSAGFKGALRALDAQETFKNRLIEDGSKVWLSKWHPASQTDRDAAFNAMLQLRVSGAEAGTAEHTAVMSKLTEPQRQMVAQASGNTGMIGRFLWRQYMAESAAYQKVMTPEEWQAWTGQRKQQLQGLIAGNYAPLDRVGDFTVRLAIDTPDGASATVGYLTYESQAEAIVAAKQLQDEITASGADIRVEGVGDRYVQENDNELSFSQVLSLLQRQGISLQQEDKVKLAKALLTSDSLRFQRMMRAKKIPGYSHDGWRVLHRYIVRMSGQIARTEFSDHVSAALDGQPVTSSMQQTIDPNNGMPAEVPVLTANTDKAANLWAADGLSSGYYRGHANRVAAIVLSPVASSGWSTRLRSWTMSYFLGGSLGAGVVQMLSVPMNTVPYLSQHTDYTNAWSTSLASWKDTLANPRQLQDLNALRDPAVSIPAVDKVPGLRAALIEAVRDGTASSSEVHQIQGYSRGGLLSRSKKAQAAMDVWLWPFKFGEGTSRVASFISGYKIGREKGLTDTALYDFARAAVDETQNRFDPVNRPLIASHDIGALLFMFKSFPLFMVEMIETMARSGAQGRRAAIFMLLGLTVMTGTQGLPFAEDILDLIDVISQRVFNSPFNARRAMRNVFKDATEAVTGTDLSNVFLRGVINDMVGLNVATRVGNGDVLPGTRIGAADADYGRTMEQLLGAPFSMVMGVGGSIGKFSGSLLKGDFDGVMAAVRAGGPTALRNLVKGSEQLDQGFAQDARGQKIVDVDSPYALFQAIGIAPSALTKAYDADSITRAEKAFYTQVRSDFTAQMTKALKDGNSDKLRDIFDSLKQWNEANPEMPIMLSPATIRRNLVMSGMPLNERTVMLLPRQLRGTAIADQGG